MHNKQTKKEKYNNSPVCTCQTNIVDLQISAGWTKTLSTAQNDNKCILHSALRPHLFEFLSPGS